MYMKTFLIILKNSLKNDYPDLVVELYLSRRSKFVHLGLDIPISQIFDQEKFISTIKNLWDNKKTDEKFKFVDPYLIHATKWKYDYIIFAKSY